MQLRILYTARLSFKTEEEIEFPRQTKTKGVHDHENIPPRNLKGHSLSGKKKKKKKDQKQQRL